MNLQEGALPIGPWDVIVADPPWMYQKRPGSKGAGTGGILGYAENAYPTMTNEALAAMPIAEIAARDAHLFMWFTNPGAFGGRFSDVTPAQIAQAWGFEFKTILTWVKTTREGEVSRGGMGWYFRGCTEHVLYATRGRAGIPAELREPNVLMVPHDYHRAAGHRLHDMPHLRSPADVPMPHANACTDSPGATAGESSHTSLSRDASSPLSATTSWQKVSPHLNWPCRSTRQKESNRDEPQSSHPRPQRPTQR